MNVKYNFLWIFYRISYHKVIKLLRYEIQIFNYIFLLRFDNLDNLDFYSA